MKSPTQSEAGGRRLRSAVQRALARRVVGAAVAISLLFAGVTWLRLAEQVGDDVVHWVLYRTALFNAAHGLIFDEDGLSDPSRLQAELDRAVANRHPPEGGRFVAARFYDSAASTPSTTSPNTWGSAMPGSGGTNCPYTQP